MHTSLFSSPTSRHRHQLARRQTFPGSNSNISPSRSTTSMFSLLRKGNAVELPTPTNPNPIQAKPLPTTKTPSTLEAEKIQRNSLYLTFNAPQVDDYHRGIFLTHAPCQELPDPRFSGTLFHASYITVDSESKTSTWVLEQRPVNNVTSSNSLVLLFKIGSIESSVTPVDEQLARVGKILAQVPLGRKNREQTLGPLNEGEGNPVLDGYDCVIWTKDAMSALANEGLIDLDGMTSDELMAKVRAIAGPPDAKSMVGVDFGGFRVIN